MQGAAVYVDADVMTVKHLADYRYHLLDQRFALLPIAEIILDARSYAAITHCIPFLAGLKRPVLSCERIGSATKLSHHKWAAPSTYATIARFF